MNAKQNVLQKCKVDLIYQGHILRPEDYYLPTPSFHYKIASLLTDPSIKQGVIVAPRDSAKSFLSVEAVRSHYLHINTELDSVIIIQSKTRKEAIKRLWSIKSMIKYNAIYRDLYGKHSDKDLDINGNRIAPIWQADYIKFQYNGHWITITAIGSEQQVRGILEEGTRVTFLLLDDAEDENNTASKDQMEKNYDSLLAAIATLDKRIGYIRIIGTPIVQGCMVDRIVSNPTGWKVQWYSANKDADGKDGLLWIEKYSKNDLDNIKADLESKGKLRNYYADYECTVKGKGEEFFKQEYLQYYQGKLEFIQDEAFLKITHRADSLENMLELSIPEIRPVNIFIGVDPASSVAQKADYTVIMPIAYDEYRNIYVLPYYHQRVPSTAVVQQMIEMAKYLRPKRMHVESTQYQVLLKDSVKEALEDEGISIPGLEKKYLAIGDKGERLETMHHFFANRKVYFLPESEDFVRELLMFGSKREHDDTLDAFYYATRKLILPDHTLDTVKEIVLDDEEQMAQLRRTLGLKGKISKSLGYLAA